MTLTYDIISSPLGPLTCVQGTKGWVRVALPDQAHLPAVSTFGEHRPGSADDLASELEEYFAGTRTCFSVDVVPSGTSFQELVWQALREVPYGETVTYGELARRVGRPSAARAIGAAIGRNPLAIVVPCHRVVGADGSLTGFAGGLDAKRFLLSLEAA